MLSLLIAMGGCLQSSPSHEANLPATTSTVITTPSDATPTPPSGPQSEPISLRSLANGSNSGAAATMRVLRTEGDWAALWEEHASREMPHPPRPLVGFPNESVVAVILPEKGSGCYRVAITGASYDTGTRTLTFDVTRYEPGPGAACTANIVTPFDFEAYPDRGDATVRFTDRVVKIGGGA